MTHSALLIAAGALLTSVVAALLFSPSASAEERQLRDVQRLLRALEAQRRVRDARRRREVRRSAEPPAKAEQQAQVSVRDDRADRGAAAHERKRAAKAHAAALKTERLADKRAHREAERERKAAIKEMRAEQREATQERKRALRAVPAPTEPELQRAPASANEVADEPKRLSELPLYSWATRIESEDETSIDER